MHAVFENRLRPGNRAPDAQIDLFGTSRCKYLLHVDVSGAGLQCD
jgi:hypothetical protein